MTEQAGLAGPPRPLPRDPGLIADPRQIPMVFMVYNERHRQNQIRRALSAARLQYDHQAAGLPLRESASCDLAHQVLFTAAAGGGILGRAEIQLSPDGVWYAACVCRVRGRIVLRNVLPRQERRSAVRARLRAALLQAVPHLANADLAHAGQGSRRVLAAAEEVPTPDQGRGSPACRVRFQPFRSGVVIGLAHIEIADPELRFTVNVNRTKGRLGLGQFPKAVPTPVTLRRRVLADLMECVPQPGAAVASGT